MFNQQVIDDAKSHALASYPHESCGMVVGDQYIACTNVAENPLKDFAFDPKAYPRNGALQAVIHSHPNKKRDPSKEDMAAQVASAKPWGIMSVNAEGFVSEPLWWGPGVAIPPLIGRTFRWGPSGSDNGGDCYALIKDYYALEMGIALPEYPREFAWWERGEDMYSANFKAAGFAEISVKELRTGDVILMRLLSKVTNHGGIFLGDKPGKQGLWMHHAINRLSREEPFHPWLRQATHFLRYDGSRSVE